MRCPRCGVGTVTPTGGPQQPRQYHCATPRTPSKLGCGWHGNKPRGRLSNLLRHLLKRGT